MAVNAGRRGDRRLERRSTPHTPPFSMALAALTATCAVNAASAGRHSVLDAHAKRSATPPGPAVDAPSAPDGACEREAARSLPFFAAHGRPQAEAVARAHEQAPVDAQDLGSVDQRVPAVPPAAASAPGLPALRLLRG